MILNFKDEWLIRGIIFLVVAVGLFICEKRFSQFKTGSPKRIIINLSFHLINIVVIRLILPGAALSIAYLSEEYSSGILRPYLSDGFAMIVVTILIMEWAIYIQHILFHKIPFLWKLHSIHHCDTSVDFTTALRFHPLEILISMVYKGVFIFLLGFSATGVVIFEILLNTMAMFNHANIKLPVKLESFLRTIIVTPEMHRIHHSRDIKDHHKNFSFSLSIWDRLFKTYKKPDSLKENQVFGTGNQNLDGQEDIGKLLLLGK